MTAFVSNKNSSEANLSLNTSRGKLSALIPDSSDLGEIAGNLVSTSLSSSNSIPQANISVTKTGKLIPVSYSGDNSGGVGELELGTSYLDKIEESNKNTSRASDYVGDSFVDGTRATGGGYATATNVSNGFLDKTGQWPTTYREGESDWHRFTGRPPEKLSEQILKDAQASVTPKPQEEYKSTFEETREENRAGKLVTITPATGDNWEEPESDKKTQYGDSWVWASPGGVIEEIDSTEGCQAWRIIHPSNSYLEVNGAGDFIQKTFAKRYDIIATGHNTFVNADRNTSITGQELLYVQKDTFIRRMANKTEIIMKDNDLQIMGNNTVSVSKDESYTILGNQDISINGTRNVKVGKGYTQTVGSEGLSFYVLGSDFKTVLTGGDHTNYINGNQTNYITGEKQENYIAGGDQLNLIMGGDQGNFATSSQWNACGATQGNAGKLQINLFAVEGQINTFLQRTTGIETFDTTIVGGMSSLDVGADHSVLVGGMQSISVGGLQSVKVLGMQSITVGAERSIKVAGAQTTMVGAISTATAMGGFSIIGGKAGVIYSQGPVAVQGKLLLLNCFA